MPPPKARLLRQSSRSKPAEPAQVPDDPEKQREEWMQVVRECCAAAGREEKNIKAYIGNAVLNRQVAALGETIGDVLSAARKENLGDDDRAKVTKLLQAARGKIEAKDNGSKAAFSAVNQVYGTDAKFFAVPLPRPPPAPRGAKPTKPKPSPKPPAAKASSSSGGGGAASKRKAPPPAGVRVAKKGSGAAPFTFAKQARSYDAASTSTMEGDGCRMEFYREAIARVVKGKTVVDIGTGDHGILAQLALEAGAAYVHAVEIREGAAKSARRTLEALYPGQATVYCANMAKLSQREVDLREAIAMADVVVHEVFGTIASEEGIVQIFNGLLDARNGESIVSVPKQAETLIAPVTRPLKLSRGATNAEQTLWQGYATDADTRAARFAQPQPFEMLKFEDVAQLALTQSDSRVFTAERGGQWNAVHLQLRLRSGRDMKLTSGGASTNWEDVYVSVPPPRGCVEWCGGKNPVCPCVLKRGERIALSVRCRYNGDSCAYCVQVTEPKRFACEISFDSAQLHAIQIG